MVKFNKSLVIFGAFCALILGLSNSGLHPLNGNTGYTGSPVDGNCANCHTGNNTNLDGEITIDGLPSSIETGETYTLNIIITNPNGNAARAGFQLVVLNGSNGNAGSMTNPSASTQIRIGGGRNYLGHAPAPNFPASNELNFSVDWTAPATTGSNPVIKFYAATVIANGANGNGQDRVRLTNLILPITSAATPLDVSIGNVSPTLCADSANGSATASVTGGTPPYNYVWNNGVNTSTNNTLPAGLAIVTVTDNTGATSSASTNISGPPPINAVASGSVICDGATNGTVSVLANGGVGGFTYSWSTGQGGISISGLIAGTYTVTVTDNNGCQETSEANVTESPEIIISGNVNNINCFGQTNGSISTSIFGGTPGFSYSWSTGSTQANIINLAAGLYTVTVTDAANCTSTESFTILQPASALTSTISTLSNVTCFGGTNGSAQISASGGTPPYNYTWSNGASGSGNSNTQINLVAGEYVVTITDFFDCMTINEVEITQPSDINIFPEIVNPSCNGQNNGSILAVVSFATGNVSYLWSHNNSTTQSISGLSAGIYSLTVTDANGCTKTGEYNLTEPDILTATPALVTNLTCAGGNDGAVSLDVNGGNGQYTYLWSNSATTQNLSGLTSGNYSVTVTDWKACSTTSSVAITAPSAISVSVVDSLNATCLGATNGSLAIAATNGLTPYSYEWSNGQTEAVLTNVASGNYIVTVTDGNNCSIIKTFTVGSNASFSINLIASTNVACFGDSTGTASVTNNVNYTYLWSTGQTTSSVSQLPAGTHSVIATESGCQSTPLIVNITSPPLIKANLIAADTILCPGDTLGYLSLTLNGGLGSLEYLWSHGDSLLLTDTLKAGTYTISVSDENACQVAYDFEIFQADTIKVIETNIGSVLCNGESNGSIKLNIQGGFGDLDVFWSIPGLKGDTLTNLAAGNYNATITDVGGCSLSTSYEVTEPEVLTANATIIDESSAGAKDGAIIIIPIGGTAPFTILWSNGVTSLNLENLSPGVYNYVLEDFNGCMYASWAVVGGGDCGLSASYSTESATCFNTPDGAINLTINGAFSAYDIRIFSENKEIFNPLNELMAGNYNVIISDSANCITILSNIEIVSTFPEIVLEKLTIVKPTTELSNDGTITADISGGQGNLIYEWSKNGQIIGNTNVLTNVTPGNYQLKVTDMAGCVLDINDISVGAISALEEEIAKSISLVPNPVYNNFKIESEYNISYFELLDFTGKIINTQSPNMKTISINTENVNIYDSGVYVCKLLVNDQIVIKKIVVLK